VIESASNNRWEPPDGLGYSRMREIRLTGGGIALLALAMLLGLGGVVAGIALHRQAARETETAILLDAQGVRAEATVTRVWKSGGKSPQGWASYQFTHGGAIYEKRLKPPRNVWGRLREGDTLPIRFLPSDPSVNHPEDWSDRPMPPWLPYLIAALLIVTGGLLAAVVQRQTRLLAEGQPALGVIVRHKRADHGQTALYYEFRQLSGAVAQGRSVKKTAIPIGEQVCIIYNPDNPKRNAMYPLPLVRLATLRKR
jgi:hypothetical protein